MRRGRVCDVVAFPATLFTRAGTRELCISHELARAVLLLCMRGDWAVWYMLCCLPMLFCSMLHAVMFQLAWHPRMAYWAPPLLSIARSLFQVVSWSVRCDSWCSPRRCVLPWDSSQARCCGVRPEVRQDDRISLFPAIRIPATGVSLADQFWSRVVPLETPFQTRHFSIDIVAEGGQRRKHEEVECALSLILPAALFTRAGTSELTPFQTRHFPNDIVAGGGRRRKHEEVECALSLISSCAVHPGWYP
ncbi:hypothetical protein F511_26846 [Dorcoceras hygrometricum]|uniref:Uncharacterized protein n=1 Tax=Dorcoceras hygrometricum TaxID=472368 RepID=A0A2Z7B6J6_9LAMI|nr:hypothetical protein F511_26846 [Dorcoceras hygrometricum]